MPSVNRLSPGERLSSRSIEILRLLAEGLSDREIAERLVMTVSTVKWYNRQIYGALGVGSRTQAIVRARELQLLEAEGGTAQPAPIARCIPHNLPSETTRFVGRKHELKAIKRLLDSSHLLTLVGPPGTGKTRLALHLASEVIDNFPGGVYFVSLAPVSDPAQVATAIASAIGVREAQGRTCLETLKRALRETHMLLILDNFEHILLAATQISELLAAARNLKVLATSREPLHLYGEQEYAVPPLDLPDPEHFDPQVLAECESTALFVQQARAVRPDFVLTDENALDIARICVRLEGLPLAIELAAARSKLLTPRALLARLNHRLDTLTGGARDLPIRQQTLRNTIEWSYELLDEGEKHLFARLAVFVGGWSIEAAEAVCGPDLPIDVFSGLESLLDKSLIHYTESGSDGPRFAMLETLREYALEKLMEGSEAAAIRNRHAEWAERWLAEHASEFTGRGHDALAMKAQSQEYPNQRTAMAWSLEGGDPLVALKMSTALWPFFDLRGMFGEGVEWMERALLACHEVPIELRAHSLRVLGNLLWRAGECQRPRRYYDESLALYRQIDHKIGIFGCLNNLANLAGQQGEYEEARCLYEESLALARETGDPAQIGTILGNLGSLLNAAAEFDRAAPILDETLQIARVGNFSAMAIWMLVEQGLLALRQQRYDDSAAISAEALQLALNTNSQPYAARSRITLGFAKLRSADISGAESEFAQALRIISDINFAEYIKDAVYGMAMVRAYMGEQELAAKLFGAAMRARQDYGYPVHRADQTSYEADRAFLQAALPKGRFELLSEQGFEATWESTTAAVLGEEAP